MLATGVDQLPLADTDAAGGPPPLRLPLTHDHIRGADYYRRALAEGPPATDAPIVSPIVSPVIPFPTEDFVTC